MTAKIAIVLSIFLSLFHLYTGGFGVFSALDQRGIHLLFILVLGFLYKGSGDNGKKVIWRDWFFIGLAVVSSLYLLLTWRGRSGAYIPSLGEVVFGLMMIIAILEATRRHVGWALSITAMIFLAYALFGSNLPGLLAHKSYTLKRLTSFLFTTTEGIYGLPIHISATFVMLFVLFGTFLNASGAGKLFVDIAFSITGRARGGPAKAAVASSALMGSISGSSIANVVTTGTFTIPLMTKMGYPPYVAAAVEAVASTGGMIMPPVMGAVAFLIAEYVNISYLEVVKGALLPSLLFYVSVYFFVDFEAFKRNLVGLKKEELPSFVHCLKQGWYALLPLATLITWIVIGWSPMRAAFWSIVVLIGTVVFRRVFASGPLNWRMLVDALSSGAKNAIPVAIACACAGIILGVLGVTGLGIKLSNFILSLSGGSLFFGLVLSAVTSLILGIGLPATAIYIMMAVINAPALIEMGAPPLAVHLFLFYFGIISTLTPPVALTAYAAAAVAGAEPNRTGFKAFSMGILAYIIPFLFVYRPSLLMEGSIGSIVLTFFTGMIGVFFIGTAMHGHFRHMRIKWYERGFAGLGGLFLLDPHLSTDGLGGIIILVVVCWLVYRDRHFGKDVVLKGVTE